MSVRTSTAPAAPTAEKAPAAKTAPKPAAPKTTPSKPAAPAKPSAAPAPVDLAALAAGITAIKELPKAATRSAGASTNAFIPWIERSVKEGQALTTPPVADDKQATRVVDALWRAADRLGMKVSTRRVKQDDGSIAVAFIAQKKPAPAAK